MADRIPEWDLPFEEDAEPSRIVDAPLLAGGLTVMAAVVDGGPIGFQPGLVFRFHGADLKVIDPPIALVLDAARMRGMAEILSKAALAAATRAEAS